MRTYAYLRASTKEQDALRAADALEQFTHQHGLEIAARFVENESGASLKRPELFRLIEIAQQGDVLLVEQVDRLSRLNSDDWSALRAAIEAKGIRIVAMDLPTSWVMAQAGDEFSRRMFDAINGMMLDMLAAVARKDYTDRRRRQDEGIAKAKDAGAYKGRPVNQELHTLIQTLRDAGKSYSEIQGLTGAARTTISRVLATR